mmetsp:Transcript_8083/g.49956  ORF Transcript_8083/g.49956 Transcript_8083/m.49956 type:complete len:188 (+) Transcript_8083:802-1365(+)
MVFLVRRMGVAVAMSVAMSVAVQMAHVGSTAAVQDDGHADVDEDPAARNHEHDETVHFVGLDQATHGFDDQSSRDDPHEDDREERSDDFRSMVSVRVMVAGPQRRGPQRSECDEEACDVRHEVCCVGEDGQAFRIDPARHFDHHEDEAKDRDGHQSTKDLVVFLFVLFFMHVVLVPIFPLCVVASQS